MARLLIESGMADEAFALSPISARPTPPSDADYEAIRAAFVETSRGRWFLGEYARRNRNADTTMVLDAVARIEQSVTRPQPAAGLADAIRTIKAFVTEARTDAEDSLVAIERSAELASARKSARVIREIAWSLRECGTDTRICDILDAQLRGIDALHELAGSSRQADAMADVFERLLIHIDGLAESDAKTRPAAASHATRIDAAGDTTREVIAPTTPMDIPPAAQDAWPNQTSLADAALADIAYPEDDDVLDLIANEMAAPQDDVFEDDDDFAADGPVVALTESAPQTTAAVAVQPQPPAGFAPSFQPESPQFDSLESSLGAALIASGVIRTQTPAASDPLAAIGRLSQAEKIALFS